MSNLSNAQSVQKMVASMDASDRTAIIYTYEANGLKSDGSVKYKTVTWVCSGIYGADNKFQGVSASIMSGSGDKMKLDEVFQVLPSKEYGLKIKKIKENPGILDCFIQLTNKETSLHFVESLIFPVQFALMCHVFNVTNVEFSSDVDSLSNLQKVDVDAWKVAHFEISTKMPHLLRTQTVTVSKQDNILSVNGNTIQQNENTVQNSPAMMGDFKTVTLDVNAIAENLNQSLSTLTKEQMKDMCKVRGIEYKSNATKDELTALLTVTPQLVTA